MLIASSARIVSPSGADPGAGDHGVLIWMVDGDSKRARHGAGGFGSALVNGSHG